MPTIAECTILTGLGIAILGALQTGFGVLSKFLESVLERTGKARLNGAAVRSPQQKKIVERGWVKDRAYVLYADGSVEVETRLGRRIFSSLQDAQEFIA
jgi:prepilin-type processing-associated H-X9-DG protein